MVDKHETAFKQEKGGKPAKKLSRRISVRPTHHIKMPSSQDVSPLSPRRIRRDFQPELTG